MTDLEPGYYRCDRWPSHFQVNVAFSPSLGHVPHVWGFSIWRNVPGYRTLGVPLSEWLARPENAGVRVEPDHNRTKDAAFVREEKAKSRAERLAEDPRERLRAAAPALLKACENALEVMGRNSSVDPEIEGDWIRTMTWLQDAIRAARGEP